MWKWFGYAALLVVFVVVTEPAQAQITGTNWTAAFYNNTALNGDPVATEVYPEGIYFNWGDGTPYKTDNTPVLGIGADDFSVRFSSTQTFAEGGTYVFTIYVDDGMRVFFDEVPVIDQFTENTTPDFRTFTFEYPITAGASIEMRLEYVEFTGNARFAFQWGRRTAPAPIFINTPYDGETVMGDYAPIFSWQDVGAPSYVFRLWSDGGRLLLKVENPASAICGGAVCSIDSGALASRAGVMLENDEYEWQVKTLGALEKRKSAVIEFAVEYPGKPMNLTPDFEAVVTSSAPVLTWSDVIAANQYKVVLTRVSTGAKIKLGWLTDSALGCDGIWCTLDLAAIQPPPVLARGKYSWKVIARDVALASSVGKSAKASFKFAPETRSAVLPPPESAEGFRAP